jgi:hypothetical protein
MNIWLCDSHDSSFSLLFFVIISKRIGYCGIKLYILVLDGLSGGASSKGRGGSSGGSSIGSGITV